MLQLDLITDLLGTPSLEAMRTACEGAKAHILRGPHKQVHARSPLGRALLCADVSGRPGILRARALTDSLVGGLISWLSLPANRVPFTKGVVVSQRRGSMMQLFK